MCELVCEQRIFGRQQRLHTYVSSRKDRHTEADTRHTHTHTKCSVQQRIRSKLRNLLNHHLSFVRRRYVCVFAFRVFPLILMFDDTHKCSSCISVLSLFVLVFYRLFARSPDGDFLHLFLCRFHIAVWSMLPKLMCPRNVRQRRHLHLYDVFVMCLMCCNARLCSFRFLTF